MSPALEVQGLNHWAAREVPPFPSALLLFTAQQWQHSSPPRFQSSVTLPRLYTYIQSSFYIVAKDHIFWLSNGAPPVSPCSAPASARRREQRETPPASDPLGGGGRVMVGKELQPVFLFLIYMIFIVVRHMGF